MSSIEVQTLAGVVTLVNVEKFRWDGALNGKPIGHVHQLGRSRFLVHPPVADVREAGNLTEAGRLLGWLYTTS